jgi:hypothetical protein
MGRFMDGDRRTMVRPMLSYGATEDLQLSVSLPLPLDTDASFSNARAFTRMPASRDVELMLGWRVQKRGTGVGSRQETTIWLAADVPTDEMRDDLETAPSLFGSAVTGYASRSLYLWIGGAYETSFAGGPEEHREGTVAMGSLVVGYRPAAFRGDYPEADWRAFVELVAETTGRDESKGVELADTGGRQLYGALTVLGLYGSWGLAGGPALPIYQALNGSQPDEGVRLVLNVTFWF